MSNPMTEDEKQKIMVQKIMEQLQMLWYME